MPCYQFKTADGIRGFVCTGRRPGVPRCEHCKRGRGVYQCDWKMGGGKTCDKFICSDHALEVAPDKHLCPEHQRAYEDWKREHHG